MATITLTLSRKSDKITNQHEVLMEFWHGRKIHQRAKTNVYVHPDYWNGDTQSVIIPKWRLLTDERKQLVEDLQEKCDKLNRMASHIQGAFQALNKTDVAKDWLKTAIEAFNNPKDTTATDGEKKRKQPKRNFYDWFELFLKVKEYPESSTKSFRVIERALGRYEGYVKVIHNKRFKLDVDTITKDTITDFFDFFKNEYQYKEQHSKLFERLLSDYPTEITTKRKTQKIVERGHNHVVNLKKKLKRFFLWLNKEGYSSNNPFEGVEIKAEKYGDPIIITLDERNKIADFDLSASPHLERQRDVFIFQCLIGCRVSDLLKLTADNVINTIDEDGVEGVAVQYIPRKTQNEKAQILEVPLNERALSILAKYEGVDLSAYANKSNPNPLLPFISSQKYNKDIKSIFKACGINRLVIVLNPITGEQETKPLHEIASSHMARRCFVGNMYNQVQDPNLISSMSGHVEGSREFARYRKIGMGTKRKAVDLIN